MSKRKPLHVIATAQRKGGPGKTTLTKTLAEYLVLEKRKKVLLLDFDSQCNLSHLYLDMEVTPDGGVRPPVHPDYDPNDPDDAQWSGRSSSADMFWGEPAMAYPVVAPAGAESLEIMPGDSRRLTRVEEQEHTALRDRVIEQARGLISTYIENTPSEDRYDVILIDTSPSASPLTRAAVRAATHLLIPVELEEQCVEGMLEMLGLWREENRRRPSADPLEILAIQPNRVKMQRLLHQSFLENLKTNRASAPYLSGVLIPDNAAFAERDVPGSHPRSVFQLAPSNKARRIATQFGQFIYERLYPEEAGEPNLEEVANGD